MQNIKMEKEIIISKMSGVKLKQVELKYEGNMIWVAKCVTIRKQL